MQEALGSGWLRKVCPALLHPPGALGSLCCAWKGPLGAAEEPWLVLSPYPLSAVFLNYLFLLREDK